MTHMAELLAAAQKESLDSHMQVQCWRDSGLEALLDPVTGPADTGPAVEELLSGRPELSDEFRDCQGGSMFHRCVQLTGLGGRTAARAQCAALHLLSLDPEMYSRQVYKDPDDDWGHQEGATALHVVAAAHSDELTLELAVELLRAKSPTDARAYGEFFAPQPGGKNSGPRTYFGEYPLSFAVSAGNAEVAKILLGQQPEAAADGHEDRFSVAFAEPCRRDVARHCLQLLMQQDTFGNTCLHLAVLHRRPSMCNWIVNQADDAGGTEALERLLHTRGAQGLTPLSMAAMLGYRDVFSVIIMHLIRKEWSYGHVSRESIPLQQIDTIPLQTNRVIFRPVIRIIYMNRILELADDPWCLEVMRYKFDQMRGIAMITVALHIGFLSALAMLASDYADFTVAEPAPSGELPSPPARLQLLERVLLIAVCALMLTTVLDVIAGAKLRWMYTTDLTRTVQPRTAAPGSNQRAGGAAAAAAGAGEDRGGVCRAGPPPGAPSKFVSGPLWKKYRHCEAHIVPVGTGAWQWLLSTVSIGEYKVLSWLGQLSLIVHAVSFYTAGQQPTTLASASLALGVSLMYQSTLEYTVYSKRLSILSAILVLTFSRDVVPYVIIFCIWMLSFAGPLYILLDRSHPKVQWTGLLRSLDSMWQISIGNEGYRWGDLARDKSLDWLVWIFVFCFSFLAILILANLLIAMFTSTYEDVMSTAAHMYYREWGRWILLVEARCRLVLPRSQIARFRVNHFTHEPGEHRVLLHGDLEDPGTVDDETGGGVVGQIQKLHERLNKKLETIGRRRRDSVGSGLPSTPDSCAGRRVGTGWTLVENRPPSPMSSVGRRASSGADSPRALGRRHRSRARGRHGSVGCRLPAADSPRAPYGRGARTGSPRCAGCADGKPAAQLAALADGQRTLAIAVRRIDGLLRSANLSRHGRAAPPTSRAGSDAAAYPYDAGDVPRADTDLVADAEVGRTVTTVTVPCSDDGDAGGGLCVRPLHPRDVATTRTGTCLSVPEYNPLAPECDIGVTRTGTVLTAPEYAEVGEEEAEEPRLPDDEDRRPGEEAALWRDDDDDDAGSRATGAATPAGHAGAGVTRRGTVVSAPPVGSGMGVTRTGLVVTPPPSGMYAS